MAVNNSFQLVEEELSCPICFEEYNLFDTNKSPKLLLCLHTFCLSCIETLRRYDGLLSCSICRMSHRIQQISELMDNYVIHDYLKIQQEKEDLRFAKELIENNDNQTWEQEIPLRAIRVPEVQSENSSLNLSENEDANDESESERTHTDDSVEIDVSVVGDLEETVEDESEVTSHLEDQSSVLEDILQEVVDLTPSSDESNTDEYFESFIEHLEDVTSSEDDHLIELDGVCADKPMNLEQEFLESILEDVADSFSDSTFAIYSGDEDGIGDGCNV